MLSKRPNVGHEGDATYYFSMSTREALLVVLVRTRPCKPNQYRRQVACCPAVDTDHVDESEEVDSERAGDEAATDGLAQA